MVEEPPRAQYGSGNTPVRHELLAKPAVRIWDGGGHAVDESKRELILVSACLAGIRCRYDGTAKPCDGIAQLIRHGRAIPVCPEQMGGLPTPRAPAERRGDRVMTRDSRDVTEEFERGAIEALRIAQLVGASQAILKARSPSCGSGQIYDGTFSGTLVDGDGILAGLCKRNGIRVMTEEEFTRV
jgi:uncharacterized protein YbbK (DUF523 family)